MEVTETNKIPSGDVRDASFTLNQLKALGKKAEACQRDHFATKNTQGGYILTLSPSAYEFYKGAFLNLDSHISNRSVQIKNDVDASGATFRHVIFVYINSRKSYTINCFNTTSRFEINGQRSRLFIESDLPVIHREIQDLLVKNNIDLDSLNIMISEACQLAKPKSSESTSRNSENPEQSKALTTLTNPSGSSQLTVSDQLPVKESQTETQALVVTSPNELLDSDSDDSDIGSNDSLLSDTLQQQIMHDTETAQLDIRAKSPLKSDNRNIEAVDEVNEPITDKNNGQEKSTDKYQIDKKKGIADGAVKRNMAKNIKKQRASDLKSKSKNQKDTADKSEVKFRKTIEKLVKEISSLKSDLAYIKSVIVGDVAPTLHIIDRKVQHHDTNMDEQFLLMASDIQSLQMHPLDSKADMPDESAITTDEPEFTVRKKKSKKKGKKSKPSSEHQSEKKKKARDQKKKSEEERNKIKSKMDRDNGKQQNEKIRVKTQKKPKLDKGQLSKRKEVDHKEQGKSHQKDRTADYIPVQGSKCVLSNFYQPEHGLVYHGIHFDTAEHLYQFRRAYAHYDDDVAEMLTQNNYLRPGEAKRLADTHVQNSTEWNETKAEEVMTDILNIRAEQDLEFCEELIKTEDRVLVHTVPDLIWGTGSYKMQSEFSGQNRFGMLLMNLRERLRAKNETFASVVAKSHKANTMHGDIISTASPIQPVCDFCGLSGHLKNQCYHGKPLQCYVCYEYGHKAKKCFYY